MLSFSTPTYVQAQTPLPNSVLISQLQTLITKLQEQLAALPQAEPLASGTVLTTSKPSCDTFTAKPTSIKEGDSATLEWKTSNAKSVSINHNVGSKPVDGSKSVKPPSTTKYTLTASNADGAKVTCTTTVTVKSDGPNLSFCANTYKTKSGTLCAIQPSKIDSRTKDVTPPTGEVGDNLYGFGYHVFAVPSNWSAAKGVWIHFTGSYGRPYDQNDKSYSTTQWLDELMGQGYAVLQIAYDNRFSVNGDLCGELSPGYNRDNCAGEVREIGLSGKGTSPYRSTDKYNTINYRLKTLVGYIEDTQKINLPDSLSSNNIDWSKLNISGHSQGSNQAYFIAKQQAVASLCILAGVYDINDTVKPSTLDIADWFPTGTDATPVSKITALLTKTDDNYQPFYSGLTKALGVPRSQIVIDDSGPYYNESGEPLDGHAGTIHDPALKSKRAEACFR